MFLAAQILPRRAKLLLSTAVLAFPFLASAEAPADLGDGFRTTTPDGIGLTSGQLRAMTEMLRQDVYPNVHALLIRKDGYLVYEEYFAGRDGRFDDDLEWETVDLNFDSEMLHQTRSITKSITSAVVGLAIADGAIESVDVPVFPYFPEHADKLTDEKRNISLQHLLTMSAGIDWNEEDVPYSSLDNDEVRMDASDDPVGFVLGRNLVSEPGANYYYNGGLPVLSGFMVSRATGQSFAKFANEKLFEPLGIDGVEWGGCCGWDDIPEMRWDTDKPWARFVNPAAQLWIRPRDLLKFGSLYLDEGRWNDKQILPPDWVSESLRAHIPQRYPEMRHGDGAVARHSYGYFWWHLEYELPYGNFTVHAAYGNGGLRIWIVPSLDLVAVHLTGNYNLSTSSWNAERLLLEQILPWAAGVKSDYEHETGVEIQTLQPGDWPNVDINPAAYVGSWEEDGGLVSIIDDADHITMLRSEGANWDLLPESETVFAFGRIVDGVPASIFWKDFRLIFIPNENGQFDRYEIREVNRNRVVFEGTRASD